MWKVPGRPATDSAVFWYATPTFKLKLWVEVICGWVSLLGSRFCRVRVLG